MLPKWLGDQLDARTHECAKHVLQPIMDMLDQQMRILAADLEASVGSVRSDVAGASEEVGRLKERVAKMGQTGNLGISSASSSGLSMAKRGTTRPAELRECLKQAMPGSTHSGQRSTSLETAEGALQHSLSGEEVGFGKKSSPRETKISSHPLL